MENGGLPLKVFIFLSTKEKSKGFKWRLRFDGCQPTKRDTQVQSSLNNNKVL